MVPRPEVRYLWYPCGSLGGFYNEQSEKQQTEELIISNPTCNCFENFSDPPSLW